MDNKIKALLMSVVVFGSVVMSYKSASFVFLHFAKKYNDVLCECKEIEG